jgi:hypothetical protein
MSHGIADQCSSSRTPLATRGGAKENGTGITGAVFRVELDQLYATVTLKVPVYAPGAWFAPTFNVPPT